jgi:hypothetical protein
LIEKGLVIDHQVRAGSIPSGDAKQESNLWPRLFDTVIENVMLTRKLIRQSVATMEEHREILRVAAEGVT